MRKPHYVYCGFDCSKCPLYMGTESEDNDFLKDVLKSYNMYYDNMNLDESKCRGCDHEQCNKFTTQCFIKNCCLKKGIINCGFCDEYPCEYIQNYIKSAESLDYLNNIHEQYLKGKEEK